MTDEPPKRRPGRPRKEEVAARQKETGPGAWEETHKGVTQDWLKNALRMDIRTVKMRLANCPVLAHSAKGLPRYDLPEAIRYLAKPSHDTINTFFRNMKVGDLPVFLQQQYWAGQRQRQIYEENAGHLWRTEDVLDVLGEVFKGMKDEIQLWVENVDQKEALSQIQRTSLLQQVDALQENLHARLVEMPRRRATPSQLEAGDVVTEESPQYAGIYEADDDLDELLG